MDRAVAAGLPGGHRLGQVGDEEAAAAGNAEGPHHGAKPEPVAVGLGDGGAFGAPGARLQQPPIRDERAEVDSENAAGFRVRRACFNEPGSALARGRSMVPTAMPTPCSGQGIRTRHDLVQRVWTFGSGKARLIRALSRRPASIRARR